MQLARPLPSVLSVQSQPQAQSPDSSLSCWPCKAYRWAMTSTERFSAFMAESIPRCTAASLSASRALQGRSGRRQPLLQGQSHHKQGKQSATSPQQPACVLSSTARALHRQVQAGVGEQLAWARPQPTATAHNGCALRMQKAAAADRQASTGSCCISREQWHVRRASRHGGSCKESCLGGLLKRWSACHMQAWHSQCEHCWKPVLLGSAMA